MNNIIKEHNDKIRAYKELLEKDLARFDDLPIERQNKIINDMQLDDANDDAYEASWNGAED